MAFSVLIGAVRSSDTPCCEASQICGDTYVCVSPQILAVRRITAYHHRSLRHGVSLRISHGVSLRRISHGISLRILPRTAYHHDVSPQILAIIAARRVLFSQT
ncbi:hypothetical protein AB1N83_004226 [Pleurotus pulmonarius]